MNKRAPKCKALGCTRRTRREQGFCFQHFDMAPHNGEEIGKQSAAHIAIAIAQAYDINNGCWPHGNNIAELIQRVLLPHLIGKQ